ncbi:MAG: GHMP kinase [Betaproteobacteria bacterium HGW-Betaproteobacteria-22]|nr:MAG: GHMP kinase [Betaproteobacteria bacterium HGW-Betaproteobacteria-22]
MTASVKIKSSGRLHMGFFDLNGNLGRKYGSIGLSLSAPNLVVNAEKSTDFEVSAHPGIPVTIQDKVRKIAMALFAELGLEGAVKLHINEAMPEHSGLGSGTQLGLTVGAAINHLYRLNLSAREIARHTGRGARSGVGIAAFDEGGLIVDGGRQLITGGDVPPLLARYDFPEDWPILLIFDESQSGVHGDQEIIAFHELPAFPEALSAHLCRHVLMQAMPAIVERDLAAFGESIQVLQQHIGDYFAPAQGGRYASKKVGEVLEYLGGAGVACYGQSSWGPTGFAIFETEVDAKKALLQLESRFKDASLSWKICTASNHGAEFTVSNS